MQPRDSGDSSGEGQSREDKVRYLIEDLMDRLPEEFNMADMMEKVYFLIGGLNFSRKLVPIVNLNDFRIIYYFYDY